MYLTKLCDLVSAHYNTTLALSGADSDITHITQDSRQVKAGSLFAAIAGTAANGENFITQALEAGASALMVRSDYPHTHNVPIITSNNPRLALAQLASTLYQPPPECMVAVTGTDGKTSVAEFVRQLWELMDISALSVGTLGLRSAQELYDLPALSENTTPEAVTLYQALSTAAAQGVGHVVCEASSHGLSQYRLDGLRMDAAIFTSFSQDHLDYHGTMDAYFDAKARLFHDLLTPEGVAILCSDYPQIADLKTQLPQRAITYGTHGDLTITQITPDAQGQHILFRYHDTEHEFHLPIYGTFQAYNVLAAMLAVHVIHALPIKRLLPHAARLKSIKGRLEQAGTTKEGALIFVDYAHTPAALQKALETMRPYATHQLHVVFGCGGDRDAGKRPLMGAVAHHYADKVIITDDNPRTEDAATIRASIAKACPDATLIANRADAIRQAVQGLKGGDVLLIAGKGHEDYQIIGTTKHPFDDARIAQEALHDAA